MESEPSANRLILFQSYRIFIKELDTKQITFTIINPSITKKYFLETTTSFKTTINTDTLIAGF